MNAVLPAAAAVYLLALGAAPARAGSVSLAPGLQIDGSGGDWRRHEIVRIWRDQGGCRLSIVSYRRPDGEIDTRESRTCGKD
jgi:hypothetical protein